MTVCTYVLTYVAHPKWGTGNVNDDLDPAAGWTDMDKGVTRKVIPLLSKVGGGFPRVCVELGMEMNRIFTLITTTTGEGKLELGEDG